MSYVRKHGLGYLIRKSNAHDTAENLAASAAVYGGYLVTKPCALGRFMFYVNVLVEADNVVPVVEVNRRPTYNSSSGELLIAQLTLPEAAAVGKVYYKDVEPYQLQPGDELSFEHVTQATDSGTAAGTGFYDAELHESPESDGNLGDLVASA